MHAAPFGLRPQEVTPDAVSTQVAGGTHPASATQPLVHAPEAQMKGSHCLLPGVTQAPAPSQVEAGVATDVLAQTADLQLRPLA